MSDLVAFLRARYDERERVARQAATANPGAAADHWSAEKVDYRNSTTSLWVKAWGVVPARVEGIVMAVCPAEILPKVVTHIALNDPAYVLADIVAKRQILDLHTDPKHSCLPGQIQRDGYTWYEAGEKRWADIPCLTLRLLAAPFASHPDFDPAWAVDAT